MKKLALLLALVAATGCAVVWQIARPGMDVIVENAVRKGVVWTEEQVGEEVSPAFEDALVAKVQEELAQLLEPEE